MKKVISITMILISLLVLYSCNERDQVRGFKKEVLQENVLEDLNKEDQVNIGVEELDLKLPEGEFFIPTFYIGEEAYGYVDNRLGNKLSIEKFLVGGRIEPNLYRVGKNNTLTETSKKVFNWVSSPKNIGYEDSKNSGKLYSIDYTKENEPTKEMKDLDDALKAAGVLYHDSHASGFEVIGHNKVKSESTVYGVDRVSFDNAGNGETNYIQITYVVPFSDGEQRIYFYDMNKEKLYKRTGDLPAQGNILYVNALKSFVRIDKDLKCYKVVFGKGEYDFVEFLDLKPYIGATAGTDSFDYFLMDILNDEEVLLERIELVKNTEHLDYIPTYQTKSIGTFNFKTNQFNELLVTQENQYIIVKYIGNIKATGGNTFIIDVCEVENGSIARKERFFKVIEDGKLRTLYKENIGAESNTMTPSLNVIVREDGKEIFLKKDIILLEMGREATKGSIYKKYVLE